MRPISTARPTAASRSNRAARRAATGLAAVATVGLLAACGTTADAAESGDSNDTDTAAAESTDPLVVGVFLPGSISDTGFMQSAHLGVERAQETHGDAIDVTYVEEVAASDYEQVLVRFASESDLVISVGGQTDADVRAVAPQFPDVTFVEIGGPSDAEPLDNLAYYDPEQAEAEYLSGAVAALSSESGSIGFIGGVELPAIVNASGAFANGAEAAVPGTEVVTAQFLGDFNDPAKAKQAAAANFSVGVDVIGQIVNLGKTGIEQAAQDADASMIGGPIPGECADPYVGFVRTDIGTEVEYAIDSVLDGSWEAAQVPFGLTTDREGTEFVLCTDDAETAASLAEIEESVASGSVEPY
ncbi:BMP family ABC transporter substrate-binding protein [Paraoerskovia sediminicola]|uniref:BMP family ABC transporter substrate-binding protein n=1 Tax=Paraoerskovia sediminicola TaxID=1138587 RepID=A0ABM8G089_9CELL|nr:BMP family ABC transporter substrate-binding protein [Paraoerskovia sediminicola]BDZ41399.1 BMP family ABC transporter substrate-binding protein [Paraoerskovia sediminicola]